MASQQRKQGGGPTSVRVFRLGEEPRDDLSETTTAEERLELLGELTERAWSPSGRAFPTYSRRDIPVRVTRIECADFVGEAGNRG
ncbi:MAG: hypothetical protein PVH96_12955 [Gemmatimonadota bacterium]|jgi:hypothetical protein